MPMSRVAPLLSTAWTRIVWGPGASKATCVVQPCRCDACAYWGKTCSRPSGRCSASRLPRGARPRRCELRGPRDRPSPTRRQRSGRRSAIGRGHIHVAERQLVLRIEDTVRCAPVARDARVTAAASAAARAALIAGLLQFPSHVPSSSMPPSVSVLILNYNGRDASPDVPPDGRGASLSEKPPVDRGDRQRLDRRVAWPSCASGFPTCASTPRRATSGSRRPTTTWRGRAPATTRLPEQRHARRAHLAERAGGRGGAARRRSASPRGSWTGTASGSTSSAGSSSFIGHSLAARLRRAVDRAYGEEPRCSFACGGSMLIGREAFLDAGGFDEDFFAYFEDVDLGWRLNAARPPDGPRAEGGDLSPRCTAPRRGGRFAQRLRLYERNALAMIYKNYEDETPARASCRRPSRCRCLRGLLARRASTRRAARSARRAPTSVDVPARTVVHLIALEDFAPPAAGARRQAGR